MKKLKPSTTRLEDRLSSVYETILTGFHGEMTVAEMVKHIHSDAEVPPEIADIELACFTPGVYEAMKDFWQTPVDRKKLSPEIQNALDDEDIAYAQAGIDYELDPENPTLETLARVVQMQHLGFQIRLAELTNPSFIKRLEKFKDPAYLEEFAKSPFVTRYDLHHMLPKKPLDFKIADQETCSKQLKSALNKAYYGSGKEKSLEAFLENPNAHGTKQVSDIQRIRLDVAPERYTETFNALAIMIAHGGTGIHFGENGECSNQVLYPGKKGSSRYPTGIFKGESPYFPGMALRCEIQCGDFLPKHAKNLTHTYYKTMGELEKDSSPDARNALETFAKLRHDTLENNLPAAFRDARRVFDENGKPPKDDKAFWTLNKLQTTVNPLLSARNAIDAAYTEALDADPTLEDGKAKIYSSRVNEKIYADTPQQRRFLRKLICHADTHYTNMHVIRNDETYARPKAILIP